MSPGCTGLTVSPATWTLPPGGTLQLRAYASCGTAVPQNVTSDAATTWTVVDTGSGVLGTVSASGFFTASQSVGSVVVQAIYAPSGGTVVSGNATLTVSGTQVLSVTVAPAAFSLHPGTVQALTATADLDGGSAQDVTLEATWTSSNPDVVAVSCNGTPGQVCALDAGSATVTATYRSESGPSAVTVLPASDLESVTVAPATVDVPAGPAVCETFQVTGSYADGTSGPVEAAFRLSPQPTLDGGIGLVAATPAEAAQVCLASEVPPQTLELDADAGGVLASAQLTVCATTVQKVSLVPPNATLHCAASDGGPPCVLVAAEALVRACGQSSLIGVNTLATWDAGVLPAGLTFYEGLLCALPSSCPTGQTVDLTASYGGKSAAATIQTAP